MQSPKYYGNAYFVAYTTCVYKSTLHPTVYINFMVA